MAEEIVEITVRPDGRVDMRVNGVPGMDCLERTEDLTLLLGGEVEAREMTAEAYEEAYQDEHQQDRQWH